MIVINNKTKGTYYIQSLALDVTGTDVKVLVTYYNNNDVLFARELIEFIKKFSKHPLVEAKDITGFFRIKLIEIQKILKPENKNEFEAKYREFIERL